MTNETRTALADVVREARALRTRVEKDLAEAWRGFDWDDSTRQRIGGLEGQIEALDRLVEWINEGLREGTLHGRARG